VPAPTPDQIRKYFETRLGQRFDAERRQITRCPLHMDTAQSLFLDLEDGAWICNGSCGAGGLLQFEEQFSRCTPACASANIKSILGQAVEVS
jgi:hypothetical protein